MRLSNFYMLQNKFQPGYYLLNNTALIKLSFNPYTNTDYLVELLYSAPQVQLGLSSAGTVIDFKKFESIINTYGKELIPVDPTKAEVVSLIYGSGV